jgi:hypothetical protein
LSTVRVNHAAINSFFQRQSVFGGSAIPGVGKNAERLAAAMVREAEKNAQTLFRVRGTSSERYGVNVAESVRPIVRTNAKTGGIEVGVGTISPVGGYLENGTRAHGISARRAPYLRSAPNHPDPLIGFKIKSVSHPGNKPYLWLQKAVNTVTGRF